MANERATLTNGEIGGDSHIGFAIGLAAVTTLALLLRVYHLSFESLWYDELTQVTTYHLPLSYLVPAAAGHGQPPLDYLIGAGLDRLGLAGSDWWVRLPAAIFGTASVALTGVLVKRFSSSVAAITAAALLAVCPLHVVMSQEARPYMIFVFLALGMVFSLGFARRRHTPIAWLLFSASTTALILSRWIGPQILVAGASLYAMGMWIGSRRAADHTERTRESQRLWAFCSAVAVAYAIYGPVLGLILDRARSVVAVSHGAWFPRFAAQLSDAYASAWAGYSTSVIYHAAPAPRWLLACGGLLAVIGAVSVPLTVRRKPYAALCLTVLLPFPLLYAALYAKMTPIHAKPQYLLLATVPLMILVAAGLERIRATFASRNRALGAMIYAGSVAILLFPMASASWSLLNGHDKRDWRGLMTFLHEHAGANDAFAIAGADSVPASLHPAVGGKARYGMRDARFLPVDLTTTPDSLTTESWHHDGGTVWIVGIKDRLYAGRDQLPTPNYVPERVTVVDVPGLFAIGIPGPAPPEQRLAQGLAIITKNLPDGSAVVAPHLLRGRLLLASGAIADAQDAFDQAIRQCRSAEEVAALSRDYLPNPTTKQQRTASRSP